ncbi:MAG TPA: adenylate/guanylate cyclase domain-containing protein, partial [Acidimicrobiia bacterium]|nr:adenylate/guanylate cyclase domain-containing protein [Acidimicrobiia bacterium]
HVKNLIDRCFDRLAADVNAYGGQVDKIVGDAIVACFGAPVAHEDDAERAVRAGLQMQQTLAELRDLHQIGAEMRVGVNTGEVLVGALRAGGDYTAMGDAVNTASRLQTLAEPGQVLVGPATHEATYTHVRYEPVGALVVRGRDEPVEAWVAVEPVAPPGQRPTRTRTPLVGRDAEVDVLRTVLRTTIERRRAHLVLLAGEAGVGKTRLARELGVIAREEHQAIVLLGHCAPYGEANVWFPIAEAVRKACDIEDADSAETVRAKCRTAAVATTGLADDSSEATRLVEGLLYVMGQSGPGTGVDPVRARDEALRAVQAFLESLAGGRPLVLALADLHWADDLVLELVDRLMLRFRNLPFLLAATTRPELEDRWMPKPGRHNAVFVNLDPLDADTGAHLARTLLGPGADEELVAMVVERSGGNPFFIEELVAVVNESDAEPTSERNGHLPGTLRGLIAARIDALEPAERSTLEDCAVIGSTGPVELVTALAETRQAGEPQLTRLADKDLLEVERNEYVFKTDLIREVAYSTLTKAERARRHAKLSHHLAARATKTGRIEEVLDQLAYHYGAAAELIAELGTVEGVPADLNEKATSFLEQAAARAAQQETWPVAKRLLTMALETLGDTEPDRRLHLLLYRARARTELRELFSARADIDAAVELAEPAGNAAALARAMIIRGDIELKENDVAGSVATLAQAVDGWRELDDPAGLGDALRTQGMTDLFRGELDAAAEAIGEALDCFRSVEDRRGEAAALQNLAWIAFYRGDLDESEARLHESATAFAEVGDWGGLGWALGLLAWVRFNQGNLDEAERLASDVLEESRDISNRWAAGIMQVLLANTALWRGQSAAAVERAEGALEVFRELDDAWGETQALAPMVRALACLGRAREANDAMDVLTSVATRVPDSAVGLFPVLVRFHVAIHTGAADASATADQLAQAVEGGAGILAEHATLRAVAMLQAGKAREAASALEAVHATLTEQGPGAAAGAALALAYDACGRAEEALKLCDGLAEQAVTYLDHLQVAVARAFALVQLGDLPGAEQSFWRAMEIADRTDSRLDQAIARLARARAWEEMGRADADEAAREAAARLEGLGFEASGWDTAFRLAASGGAVRT